MDPSLQFCDYFYCPDRGQLGRGNIRVHSRKHQRYRCTTCGKTFTATKNTPFYRLHKPPDLFLVALVLLTHGCPPAALVAAFGLDERTVAAWQDKAGAHARRFHELRVRQGKVTAEHIQADELYAKAQGRKFWMAMAMAVESRLWLGGLLSARRDRRLIAGLVALVRGCLSCLAVLVCVDGLASYVRAFVRGFRRVEPRDGRPGRCRRVTEPGLLIGQVVKRYVGRRLVEVVRRVVRGTAAAVAAVLARTGTGTGIHTAYIERLNATFRSRLAPLARRGRSLLREVSRLGALMWLVGCAYNWCTGHGSLRGRTPAMAAGLTDRCWGLGEVLRARVVPARWQAPRRRPRRLRRQRRKVRMDVGP